MLYCGQVRWGLPFGGFECLRSLSEEHLLAIASFIIRRTSSRPSERTITPRSMGFSCRPSSWPCVPLPDTFGISGGYHRSSRMRL